MPKNTLINRQAIVSLIIILLGIVILYLPVLRELVIDWETNDNYSHGFFIPLISLYLIYCSREELSKLTLQGHICGLLLLSTGLLQLIIAKTGSEYFLQRSSLLPLLTGVVLFCLGPAFLKKLFLPIVYLIFMIPLPAIIWNKIAFPMQLFASFLTEKVVSFLGIPIFREGNILHLAGTTLEVVSACSGLRSLTTLFALSCILAILSNHRKWQKWVLFLAAAPIAILANIVRLSITALLASRYGGEVANGFLHDFSGLLVFGVGILLLLGLSRFLGTSPASTGKPQ